MFNDRDLAVLGIGAAFSVFCLLLPLSLGGKLAVGLVVLVGGMVTAFLRVGPDRLTLEEWVMRRLRYALRPRRWTFQQAPLMRRKKVRRPHVDVAGSPPEGKIADALPPPRGSKPSGSTAGALTVERLAGLLLVAAGLYFLHALAAGDAADLGVMLQELLP